MHTPLFYRQKPTFGLDIGHATVKVTQLQKKGRKTAVTAYGYALFDESAIAKGEVVNPDSIAKSLRPLLQKQLIGKLSTNRVAASIPISQTYTRILTLPDMAEHDLREAVRLEAEQYIPVPLEELYLEYEIVGRYNNKKNEPVLEVTVVATPKKIVDSYLRIFESLNLEPVRIEPSLFAIMRSVRFSRSTDRPKVVIDFGAKSSDLAIYDNSIRLINTVETGGDQITEQLATKLGVSERQAHTLKSRYGIGESRYQKKIVAALLPILTDLTDAVQKVIRYYQDREDIKYPIDGIMMVGGGANIPGLNQFLTQLTGLNVTICNPWDNLYISHLQPPHPLETTLYTTAIGLALEEVAR